MTDIIERLRGLYVQHGTNYVQEAADEIERRDATIRMQDKVIERLQADVARLSKALETVAQEGALEGGELYQIGYSDVIFDDDDSIIGYVGPCRFQGKSGETILEAIEAYNSDAKE